MKDTTWQVRVVSTGRDKADAYVRKQRISIGPPLQFDAEYNGVTAIEYLLAALGADLVNGFAAVARRHRLTIDQLEATVEGHLNNPLTYLGVVGEKGHTGLETARATLYIGTLDDAATVKKAWQETLKRSPLVNTLHKAAKLELGFKIAL
jgi:uncharacterized OsmC-like protein